MTTYPDLLNIKGIGKKRYETIDTRMQADNMSLADIYAMQAKDIKTTFGLPINVAKTIAEVGSQLNKSKTSQKQTEAPKEAKIRLIKKTDADYPKRLIDVLGDDAPDELYIWGNLELLNKPAIGFCGSRSVTEKGLSVTTDVTKQIAELGWVTVSGHARGVDSTAHRTALENNADTIIVSPEGLDRFKLRAELKRIAKKENLLIISEFPLDAAWAVGRAMQRNRTIIGLTNAMVLVESRDKGGTFDAGKKSLKYNHPLFVVDFEETGKSNAGNQHFIQRGATRLLKNRETGHANISELKRQVEAHLSRRQAIFKTQQLAMFENDS